MNNLTSQNNQFWLNQSLQEREKVAMGDKSPKNKEKRKKKNDSKKKPIVPTSTIKSIDQKK